MRQLQQMHVHMQMHKRKWQGKPQQQQQQQTKKERIKENGKKTYTQNFIKAHLANKAKVTTTKQMAQQRMQWHLFYFSSSFLVIVKKFSLRFLQLLLLLLLFCLYLHLYLCLCSRRAMKRNAHAKEVANKNGYPKNTWCQQSRLACMPTSEQQVEWNSERVRGRERVRLE